MPRPRVRAPLALQASRTKRVHIDFRLLFAVSLEIMSHQTGVSHFPVDARADQPGPVFEFEDFWRKAYSRYGPELDAIANLIRLGDQMVKAADGSAAEPVRKVVCGLTRMTIAGAVEAVVLCGNGCGLGAMKIVRGMYESRWTAEYLRRHPEEVEDYLEFSKILRWRRLHWLEARRCQPDLPRRQEASGR